MTINKKYAYEVHLYLDKNLLQLINEAIEKTDKDSGWQLTIPNFIRGAIKSHAKRIIECKKYNLLESI